VVCKEHSIGGNVEYCGDNKAYLGHSSVSTTRPWVASIRAGKNWATDHYKGVRAKSFNCLDKTKKFPKV
jgi:hypothetical protein